MYKKTDFLPTTADEMKMLGWDQADVIIFSGDAYVDHPSFGAAVIGRTLQKAGYKVAIVPQPNWRDDLRDFKNSGSRGFSSEFLPVRWTRWSIIIPPTAVCAMMMHTLRAADTGCAPTILQSSTQIF